MTATPIDRPKPGARAALILLLSINFFNYIDRQILSSLEKPISEEYHVSAEATGWLASAFLISYMLFSPVFGAIADRWRRWAIVGVGVIVWSLASGGSGAMPVFGGLIAMRLLIGVGEAAYGPVAPTLIADLYPIAIRGKVLAWFFAAIPVGSALGYVIGGMFHAHWHWAFYATVPPGILLGVWCFFMREPAREGSTLAHASARADAFEPGNALEYAPPPLSKKQLYLSLIHIKSYVIDCAGMTAMTFAIGGIGFFMPRYLEEVAGLNPAKSTPTFGAILVVAGLLATLAGGMAGDKLRSRFSGSYFLVSAAGMLVGFPLTLLMLITPFPLCWVVIFCAVFCLFFNTGPSNTIIANVTPAPIRATAFAINIFVIHLFGDAISPPVIGWVRDHYGMRAGFAVVSVMMLIGGLIWLFGARHLASDTAAASGEIVVSPAVLAV